MKKSISILLVLTLLLFPAIYMTQAEETTESGTESSFIEPASYEDHVVYSFTFDEPYATTLLKKQGATPGVINHDKKMGETGGSLQLKIGPNSMTGRGGVLPYIWPNGVSGVIAAQGALKEGEYYELQMDIAWDGAMDMGKKGTYIYPFMLINGTSENYFEQISEEVQVLTKEFDHYVYRINTLEVAPKAGEESGGIAFCCENTLSSGGSLYFDNITLVKHGEWVNCNTDAISYVEPVTAPTSYEPTDENGITASGKKTTVLYENDFEGTKKEHVFGHYDKSIESHFILEFGTGKGDNTSTYDTYFIPGSGTPSKLYSDGGYYPGIWIYNESIKEALSHETPLGKNDYYIFQVAMYAGSGYCYPELLCGDQEYEPFYEWDSTNLSENISSFGPEFITRYYVFKGEGMDLSKGNPALLFMTDGYIHSFVPIYVDDVKISVVREQNILLGDADEDGHVDMVDILTMRKFMVHIDVKINKTNADVDHNNQINMKDILMIRKSMAHILDLT